MPETVSKNHLLKWWRTRGSQAIGGALPFLFRPNRSQSSLHRFEGATATPSYASQTLAEEATSPQTACALLSALVLHFDGSERTRQLERIAWYGDEALGSEILRLEPRVVVLSPDERLFLVPAAITGLAKLPSHQRQRFMANLRSLINADEAVSIFEYTVLLLVETALEVPSSDSRLSPSRPEEVADQITTLIAMLARAVSEDENSARRASDAAMRSLSLSHRAFPPYRASFERLSSAMRGLRRASPALAERILGACEIVVRYHTPPNTSPPAAYRSLLRGLRGCLVYDSAIASSGQSEEAKTASNAP